MVFIPNYVYGDSSDKKKFKALSALERETLMNALQVAGMLLKKCKFNDIVYVEYNYLSDDGFTCGILSFNENEILS